MLMLILALLQISIQTATTGEFIHKGVSLKGGVTITIPLTDYTDVVALQGNLATAFPANDVAIRRLEQAGEQSGIIIETDIDGTDQQAFNSFMAALRENTPTDFGKEYAVEIIGSSLGASFFRETIFTLMLAFIFTGIVVFIYFRSPIPSLAVILAAFSDIVVTIAVLNIFGVKIGTAGIAALLMLIGYSIDTDILLTARVLKRTEGTVMHRVLGAAKTGLTMTFTTFIAVLIAYLFSDNEIIRQIMLIIMIGLAVDIFATWIQNVAILRWYMEKRGLA